MTRASLVLVLAACGGWGEPRIWTEPIPTDSAKYPYNHAATIAQMPNGDLLVAWGAGSRELGEDTVVVASRRRVGRSAWSPPVVIADKPGKADANPVLFVADGVVRLFYVEMFGGTFCLGRVMSRDSRDNGRTWSAPRPAFNAVCTMVKNKPLVTRGGRWIVPAYNEALYRAQFWLSDDRGTAWRTGEVSMRPTDNAFQPSVVELSDGSLLALMRNGSGGGFTWEGRSADGGATWQLAERRDLPNPNSGLDMVRLSSGWLVLVYNPSATDRTPLAVAASVDEGKSWSAPKVIEEGPGQLSYPALIQSRDRRLHVVYTHRLTHIQHVEMEAAWVAGNGK